MLLRVEFQFNAAHRLPLYEGPCFHTHGHNYQLVVFVQSEVDPATGMSTDFGAVKKKVLVHALDAIDHNDLNQFVDNPTAENVVAWIWERLRPALPGLVELELYETPDCGVIYRGEADEQTTSSSS